MAKKELDSKELDKVSGGDPNLYKPETDVAPIPRMVSDEGEKPPVWDNGIDNKAGNFKTPVVGTNVQAPIKDIFAKIVEAFRNLFN